MYIFSIRISLFQVRENYPLKFIAEITILNYYRAHKTTWNSMLEKAIFRTYDIRGDSRKNLTPDLAYNVGFHFAKMNIKPNNNKIVVGFDGRLSTPALYKALTSGLFAAGAEIISIGLVPSPCLYFANKKLYPAASIMITGSHNEKHDNGFKMLADGASFYGPNIQLLYEEILKDTKKYTQQKEEVKIFPVNIKPHYIERILQNSSINKDLKIIWDPGNGAVCSILKSLTEKLPNNNIIINEEIDGNFPNHHPDPTIPKNLEQLISEVKNQDADLGIAFDGDGDRIGVVTKSGEILFGDQLLCIYSKELLNRKPGSIIIADVKASKTLFDYVANIGGKAIMWKTGHSLIKSKMIECGAEIAGEMSGHIFFADNYLGYDDAVYAALRLISIISNSDSSLEEMLEEIPKAYSTPEIRIEVPEEKKFQIVEKLKIKLQNQKIPFNDIDGIRADSSEGWWLIRASNTQAALIARCEADSPESLDSVIKNLNILIKEFDLKLEKSEQ